MYGLQIWPIDVLFNSRKWSKWAGKSQILSDSVRGGEGGSTLIMPNLQFRKNSFVYVSMWLIFLLDNCLTRNCLTRLHTYIHTSIHTSIQTPQWPDKSLRLDGATKKSTNVILWNHKYLITTGPLMECSSLFVFDMFVATKGPTNGLPNTVKLPTCIRGEQISNLE